MTRLWFFTVAFGAKFAPGRELYKASQVCKKPFRVRMPESFTVPTLQPLVPTTTVAEGFSYVLAEMTMHVIIKDERSLAKWFGGVNGSVLLTPVTKLTGYFGMTKCFHGSRRSVAVRERGPFMLGLPFETAMISFSFLNLRRWTDVFQTTFIYLRCMRNCNLVHQE